MTMMRVPLLAVSMGLGLSVACSGATKPGDTSATPTTGPTDTSSPEAVSPGALLITEILADPLMVDGDFGEWIEVYNPGPDPIDLRGWVIADDSGDRFEIDSSFSVTSGGYAVLGRTTDASLNGGAPVDVAYGDAIKLGNDGDTVSLQAGAAEIDAVTYDLAAGFWMVEGASLSLAPDQVTAEGNDLGSAWCPASTPFGLGDLGTPGAANPACVPLELPADLLAPGDLVLTEIMSDPLAVNGDFGEWIELVNTTDHALDLEGLVVRDGSGDSFVVLSPLKVPVGGLVVFAASDDPSLNGGIAAQGAFGDAIKLGNDTDTIELLTPSGALVDGVTYDEVSFPTVEGASRSLDPSSVDPITNDTGAAWCLATQPYGSGDLGTPGAPNPACAPACLGVADLVPGDLVISELMKDPSVGELGEWFELINGTDAEVDLSGLVLRDDGDEWFVWDTALVVPPGGRVVLGASDDPSENGGAPVDGAWPADAMRLGNGDDELVLEGPGGEIDAVRYDGGDTFPDPENASISLRPGSEDENHDGASWCEATSPYGDGDLGTPGADNDAC